MTGERPAIGRAPAPRPEHFERQDGNCGECHRNGRLVPFPCPEREEALAKVQGEEASGTFRQHFAREDGYCTGCRAKGAWVTFPCRERQDALAVLVDLGRIYDGDHQMIAEL